jgi:hypothetical protein
MFAHTAPHRMRSDDRFLAVPSPEGNINIFLPNQRDDQLETFDGRFQSRKISISFFQVPKAESPIIRS